VAEALPRVVCDSHRGLIYEFAMDSNPLHFSNTPTNQPSEILRSTHAVTSG
jgi:hypothetical protein